MLINKNISTIVYKTAIFLLLVVTVVIFLLPVYWVFIKAINGPIAIFKYPPDLFPKRFSLENFRRGFQDFDTITGFVNTLKIVVINIAGTTIVSAIVAYGFARMDFPGRNIFFIIVIASILIPWDVKVIPQFMEFSYLGWTNTFLPLIVPMMFGFPFYIFVFRQFIIQIPYELDEAGIIDGCSRLGIFFRILLPLLKPPILTVMVYEFVRSWNDFLDPLIYLSKMSKYTLSLTIYYMITPFQMDWGAVMAISSLAVLFPVLVFFLMQKYLFGGLSFSGLKG
ncbi:MAG: carbohydrate ABC transporter permease [Spirochaetes bacterium]|nr:MAG: carbohydrate ABC transporter permease [Spirochaetota bacterium]